MKKLLVILLLALIVSLIPSPALADSGLLDIVQRAQAAEQEAGGTVHTDTWHLGQMYPKVTETSQQIRDRIARYAEYDPYGFLCELARTRYGMLTLEEEQAIVVVIPPERDDNGDDGKEGQAKIGWREDGTPIYGTPYHLTEQWIRSTQPAPPGYDRTTK